MAGRESTSPFPGYVCIRVQGSQLERFLNLCERQGILFQNISLEQTKELTAVLSVNDFFQLQAARRKTHVHIKVLKKSGLPFFLIRSRKRKAFLGGVLFCVFLLMFLHSRLWRIHIEGNQMYSTPEILEFLESQGIRPGISVSRISGSEVTGLLRKQFSNITWVSARKKGTGLSLLIQEGISQEEAPAPEGPCDLVAEESGTIVRMITRSGYPKVKPGDTCEKGETLVLGTFPILNDSQEVIRYEQVHADADIYIERTITYYQEYPMTVNTYLPTGETKNSFFFHVGDQYFFPDIFMRKGPDSGKDEDHIWITCQWEVPVTLAENLTLPFIFGKEQALAYHMEQVTYTKPEMEALLWKDLLEYEEKLMEKGLQISANDVTIRVSARSGVSSGTLTVIQKIGTETAITAQR